MTIIEKLRNKEELTEDEVYSLVREGVKGIVTVDEDPSPDHGRWSRYVDIVVNIVDTDEYYNIFFEEGLTEMQENYYETQVATKVKKVKKIIEVTEWEAVETLD